MARADVPAARGRSSPACALGAAAWGRSRAAGAPLDRRIVRALPRGRRRRAVVFVPGLLGSQLLRPDGSVAWLNLGNTLGHHDLTLPRRLPFAAARDELHPGFLIGTDTALPRAFGFTEYDDFLEPARLGRLRARRRPGPALRGLHLRLAARPRRVGARPRAAARGPGAAMGDPGARFHLVGHSMGGLVVRYYLRYGGADAEPGRARDAGPARGAPRACY